MKRAALAYIQQNGCRPPFNIFPIMRRSKDPLVSRGFYDATTDSWQVREWWAKWPYANIAVRCVGFVVLDIDRHDPSQDGAETLRDLEREHGELPDTPIVLTPSGGTHYYFKTDDLRLTGGVSIASGIDYRGNLGYVLVPPSVHPNGGVYEWDAGHMPAETPMAPLPEWLHELMLQSKKPEGKTSELVETIPEGQRNARLASEAGRLRKKGYTAPEIDGALQAINEARCSPPLPRDEVTAIANSISRYERGEFSAVSTPATAAVRPSDLSDAGNAEVFAQQVRGRLLWCNALGWLVWDGKRWDPNEHAATGLAITFAQQMLDDALTRFKDSMDPETGKATDEAKRYLAHAQRTRSATSLQHFLGLSKAWLHVKAADLDADWYLLNTDAGLVDLRTGEVRPHDPDALCTKIAPFSPSAAGAALWSEFLATITAGDAELERFLQVKVGSYAFGKILYEGVDFAVGGGRNGKSTLYNALGRVLGDYAGGIDSTILTTDKQNRGAALATLRGKRLVTCGELEEGQRLSVQTLKRIASTDPLTIEEKYRQPETITPSHHVVLFSNFLPRVGSTDNGTWRRISVIPFSATMPEGDADIPNYADVLATQSGGAILAWIIEGAKLFHRARYHVAPPATVVMATDRYKQREDWLERFLAERCIIERDARVRCGELYGEYKIFAQATGDYCRRGNDFAKAMEERDFTRLIVNGRPYWRGIRIDYAQDYGEPPPQFGYV